MEVLDRPWMNQTLKDVDETILKDLEEEQRNMILGKNYH